jgi:G3E family GTPase
LIHVAVSETESFNNLRKDGGQFSYATIKDAVMNILTRITIISGFLGSGKTTLLKRFIDWEFSRGSKPQVIMSEFGDFDIDGQIIADERLQVAAVTGGCICCTNRDELKNAIKTIIGVAPGSPLYIETTGVADPAGVVQTVTAFTANGDVFLSPVLVVYDANQHGNADKDSILIEKQLMTADWIILNKSDLVNEGLEKVVAEVSRINPQATIVKAVSADIDLEKATQGVTATFATGTQIEDTAGEYRSFAFKIDARLLRPEFEKWLNSLPADVLRLKGFVRFAGENGIYEVQVSRGQVGVRLFPTDRWMDATLVAITHPMRADVFVEGLKKCIPVQTGKGETK